MIQQQQPGSLARPPGQPGNLNANLVGPRPPLPIGQQQNIVRGPPPQLRRTDSRQFMQAPIPGQQPTINPQQRPQLQQQPSVGQYQPGQGPPQRPPGPIPQQPQQFQPRPINPNSAPAQRPPLLQQPLNRPIIPNQPQQLPNTRPPPILRPQGQPIANLQNPAAVRPTINNPQRPAAPTPIRQQTTPYPTLQSQNQIYSQNSFEQIQSLQDPNNMSADISVYRGEPPRSSSVLSNDDDDDVVMGKTASPMPTPINSAKPNDYLKNSSSISPTAAAVSQNQPTPLQRNDSKPNMPQRPPSSTDLYRSPTPDSPKSYTENTLSKISENFQSKDQPRPPSVTFKEDTSDKMKSSSPDIATPKHQAKSPISLNSIINTDRSGTPTNRPTTPTSKVSTPIRSTTPGDLQHRSKDVPQAERTTTPTSEKFRTTPMAKQNEYAPMKRDHLRSSIKFSKTFVAIINEPYID